MKTFWVKQYLKAWLTLHKGFLLLFLLCILLVLSMIGFSIYTIVIDQSPSGIIVFVGSIWIVYEFYKNRFAPMWKQVKTDSKNQEDYKFFLINHEKKQLWKVTKEKTLLGKKMKML